MDQKPLGSLLTPANTLAIASAPQTGDVVLWLAGLIALRSEIERSLACTDDEIVRRMDTYILISGELAASTMLMNRVVERVKKIVGAKP